MNWMHIFSEESRFGFYSMPTFYLMFFVRGNMRSQRPVF